MGQSMNTTNFIFSRYGGIKLVTPTLSYWSENAWSISESEKEELKQRVYEREAEKMCQKYFKEFICSDTVEMRLITSASFVAAHSLLARSRRNPRPI